MAVRGLSPRAALAAVLVAFATGLVASLALRPPGAALTTPAEGGASAARLHWRVPVAFGTNLKALGDNILYVAGAVKDSSGGAIELVPYEPGEIVPAFSIVDAVRDKKVPAGYTWLGYDQGKIPASALIASVPFGMEPWEFSAWWYESDGRRLTEALYARYGVHPIFCGIIGPETAGWFRKPVETPADLAGLKIRFAGIGGKVLERLGASVTMLPGGEIFQALEKGAIDATEYSLPVVDEALGFDRVAPINYFPGWHQTYTSFHLVVHLPTWQALAPADRALLETACTAGVTRNLARSEGLQGAVVSSFANRGVEARIISTELLQTLKRVTDEVLEDEAAADADFAGILASQRAFRGEYAEWRRRAYLPPDLMTTNRTASDR
jgi:TRAP-type mannitol/chloroaromatic compound transport system substrate-binding protein